MKIKNYGFGSLCMLLLATLIWGCSNEDLIPVPSNTISMNGQAFNITAVTLMGISMEGGGHAAINFIGTDGTNTRSLAVDFEYAASQPVSGTYTFPLTEGTRELDDWLTNYTEMNGSSDMSSTNLEKGSATVKDNGKSNYTITLDLEMIDGKIFKGTYQGPVQEAFHNE